MELSEGKLQLIPQADRRAVHPRIEVEQPPGHMGASSTVDERAETQDAVRRSSVISMGVLRSSAQQLHDTAERPADRE